MRKVFGGVIMHPEELQEKYTIYVKNEDDTVQNLLTENFNRKKSYGIDFVITTANQLLEQQLTEEEITWLRNTDTVELQNEILSITNISE